jgi:hypothetical protein
MVRSATSSCRHAQRRATLAGAIEGRRQHVLHHLLGQRRGIDDQCVLAAGLGHQNRQPVFDQGAARERAVDRLRHRGRTGKQHAVDARVGHQRRADGFAVARQQLQGGARNAGPVQEFSGAKGDQAGLLGRLGQHHVAGRQRGGDLAEIDRQRKIPRADADHHAQRRTLRRAGRLGGVIAQEVDRFAHFGQRVGQGLAGLAHRQRHEFETVFFEQVGGVFEHL